MVFNTPYGSYTFVSNEGPNETTALIRYDPPCVEYLLEQLTSIYVQHRNRKNITTVAILNCFQRHRIISLFDLLKISRRQFVEMLEKDCQLKKGVIIGLWRHLTQDMQ